MNDRVLPQTCPCGRRFFTWEGWVDHVNKCGTMAHRRVLAEGQHLRRIMERLAHQRTSGQEEGEGQ